MPSLVTKVLDVFFLVHRLSQNLDFSRYTMHTHQWCEALRDKLNCSRRRKRSTTFDGLKCWSCVFRFFSAVFFKTSCCLANESHVAWSVTMVNPNPLPVRKESCVKIASYVLVLFPAFQTQSTVSRVLQNIPSLEVKGKGDLSLFVAVIKNNEHRRQELNNRYFPVVN